MIDMAKAEALLRAEGVDGPCYDMHRLVEIRVSVLKAVALKFGLPNAIGDDRGDEGHYASGA